MVTIHQAVAGIMVSLALLGVGFAAMVAQLALTALRARLRVVLLVALTRRRALPKLRKNNDVRI